MDETAKEEEPLEAARAAQAVYFHALAASAPTWWGSRPRGEVPELEPVELDTAIATLARTPRFPDFRLGAAMLGYAVRSPRTREGLNASFRKLLGPMARDKGFLDEFSGLSSSEAFGHLESTLEQARAPTCAKRHHRMAFGYDVRYSIAFAEASVEVQRPLSEFAGAGDPTQWASMAPQMFLESSRIAPPEGNPYKLREVAQTTLGGLRLSKYRNDLNIDYVGGPPVELKYDLSLCLDTEMASYAGKGGLTVDSGRASIDDAGDGWSRITASKSLRHTFPLRDGTDVVLNWLSVPFLVYLMHWFVYEGACA